LLERFRYKTLRGGQTLTKGRGGPWGKGRHGLPSKRGRRPEKRSQYKSSSIEYYTHFRRKKKTPGGEEKKSLRVGSGTRKKAVNSDF